MPGKFHGQRSLVGYSPWGYKESDMTELLSMHSVLRYVLFNPICENIVISVYC